MIQEILRIFRPPSADVLALEELEEARRSLLQAQSSQEYFTCMVAYHKGRVKRLSQHTGERKGE